MTRRCLLLGLLATLFLVPQILTAQNQGGTPGTSGEAADYRGPLPFYYGKLGLSDQQKEQFYGIQKEYAGKIEALRKQIEKLEDERDAKMEVNLTPGQKLRLKELREEARRRSAEREEKEAETPATSPQK